MKALAEAQSLTPDLSSGAQARDRRPLSHLPVPPPLRVSWVSGFASEWLSFLWPRLLSSGLRGWGVAEIEGLCQPRAPARCSHIEGGDPCLKQGLGPLGKSHWVHHWVHL